MKNEFYSVLENTEETLKARIIEEEKNIFPQDVVLETTTFCNLKCVMCFRNKLTAKQSVMRWPLYIKLIEEIAQKAKDTTRLWLCFRGEPLMDKDFIDRVIFAKQKGIKNVVINSNMNLMKKDLAQDLVKEGLNNIFVGLDAATQDVYSKIRVGGNFDKAVKNTVYYKETLDKYGKSDQQIVVQFVEMPQNIHQREQVVEFWGKYGIPVKIRSLSSWAGVGEILDISTKRYNRLPCYRIMNILAVSADGFTGWCACDYDMKIPLANLNENTIENVWQTVKKEQRAVQLNGEWDKLPKLCRDCEDWHRAFVKYENLTVKNNR
ncbi:MAG: radical SAM protein [Chitinivibrionia bacterium]|nr:radical SAM protein [Chitinivibrionia bacterium]